MISKLSGMIILAMAASLCMSQSRTNTHTNTHTYTFFSSNKQGWLGVEVEDVTKRLRERNNLPKDISGAYVKSVIEDSPAEKAGVIEGDVIVKFNDTSIDDSDDLIRAVNRAKPNNEVKVDIIRKGEKKTLMATLGKSPRMKNFSFKFGDQFPHGLSIPPGDPFHFGFFPSEELYGLKLEKLTKQLGEFFEVPGDKGLLVTQVRKGSDGEKAGFKAGDVITKVGEKTIHNLDDVREELFDGKNGDVNVGIIRKGKALTLTMSVKGDDDDEEEDDDYSMISPVSPDPLCIETKASHSTCEHTEGSTYAIAPIEYLQTKLLEGVQSLMRLLKEKLLES